MRISDKIEEHFLNRFRCDLFSLASYRISSAVRGQTQYEYSSALGTLARLGKRLALSTTTIFVMTDERRYRGMHTPYIL